MNLALNGRDAMPLGGVLKLGVNIVELSERRGELTPGRYAELTVSDTGAGMDEQTRARVFEPFFTTKPVGKGTGLGLSMVFGFVRQSGGVVEIDSDVGKGTTVRLLLPLAAHGVHARQVPPVATASFQLPDSCNVLLLEDSAELRNVVRAMLEQFGATVISVPDGKAALTCDPEAFDVLLSDVVLPGELSGPDVAAHLHEVRPDLPVLFMSGYPRGELARLTGLAGSQALLAKPFTAEQLGVALAGVMRGAKPREPAAQETSSHLER